MNWFQVLGSSAGDLVDPVTYRDCTYLQTRQIEHVRSLPYITQRSPASCISCGKLYEGCVGMHVLVCIAGLVPGSPFQAHPICKKSKGWEHCSFGVLEDVIQSI